MTAAGKRIRVYADASVYGGTFDEEFDAASREFFDGVRAGRLQLVFSKVVGDELKDAPEAVRNFLTRCVRLQEPRMLGRGPCACRRLTYRRALSDNDGRPTPCTWHWPPNRNVV